MSIKDIVDSSGLNIDYNKVMSQLNTAIQSMNSNNKIDVAKLYGSSSIDMAKKHATNSVNIRDWKDILLDDMDKDRMVTIKNPERLNTQFNKSINGWIITYGGRDLSLNEDNYRWDIMNTKNGLMGYYIIERNLINSDWLNVRWSRIGLGNKEVKELIDKKRLKDKSIIQRDMITAIIANINTIK
jgi:hypothetical protein